MSTDKKTSLQQAMEHASLLPAQEPQRRTVESQVALAGEEAHREWSAWLQLNEQLKLELLRVSPPPDWEKTLLNLPEAMDDKHVSPASNRMFVHRANRNRPSLVWKWLALAALCLLLAGGGTVWWHRHSMSFSSQTQRLVLLALNDHTQRPKLEVVTSQWPDLVEKMKTTFPFSLVRPQLLSSLRLQGGRKCYLARRLVLLSRWEGQQGQYTLFQFRPSDFHLPPDIPQTQFRAQSLVLASRGTSALLWSEQKTGFVLIHEKPESSGL